jgi:dCTP deaminase
MSTLSTAEIRKRLAEGLPNGLIITPLLEQVEQTTGNTVDLRLGNEFIVTQRTSFEAIDPTLREEIESRIEEYQQHLTRRFHEKFVLHPGQLILGSTLEYVALPNNLSAYVIGRSSWGRLGLIIATATEVSPCFKGSITLELVNVGEAPLVLYPGVRIAQLVLHTVAGKGTYEGRYTCPTGPEFSKIYRDNEMQFWGESKSKDEKAVDLTDLPDVK